MTAGVEGVTVALVGVTLSQFADWPEFSVAVTLKGSEPLPVLDTVIVCIRSADVVE
jgi:hypothetical protein